MFAAATSRGTIWTRQPRQFTDQPQIGYTEGLRKLSPSLNGLFFDLFGLMEWPVWVNRRAAGQLVKTSGTRFF